MMAVPGEAERFPRGGHSPATRSHAREIIRQPAFRKVPELLSGLQTFQFPTHLSYDNFGGLGRQINPHPLRRPTANHSTFGEAAEESPGVGGRARSCATALLQPNEGGTNSLPSITPAQLFVALPLVITT